MARSAYLDIKVSGLPEVRRALRRLEGDLPDAVHDASERVAKMIIDDAKPRVPTGPGNNGHVRSSFKVVSSAGGAIARAGGARWPYLQWLEFGGRVGRKKSVRRKRMKEGRYLWVALANKRGQITDVMRDELAKLARRVR